MIAKYNAKNQFAKKTVTRDKRVSLRLTDDEYRQWVTAAGGKRVGVWARELINKSIK